MVVKISAPVRFADVQYRTKTSEPFSPICVYSNPVDDDGTLFLPTTMMIQPYLQMLFEPSTKDWVKKQGFKNTKFPKLEPAFLNDTRLLLAPSSTDEENGGKKPAATDETEDETPDPANTLAARGGCGRDQQHRYYAR